MLLKFMIILLAPLLLLANSAPEVTSTAITTVDEDSSYSYTFSATDDDNDTLTWSVTEGTTLPSWLKYQRDWEAVGTKGFSTTYAFYTNIVFDSNNTPYVAYRDSLSSAEGTVMKYDGNDWVDVGSSGNGMSEGEVNYTDIAIDSSDNLYVVYQDKSNYNRATVMHYDGNSWSVLGTTGFTSGKAYYTNIAIDSSDTVYIAYQDEANNNKATVMKYTDANSSWDVVGTVGFSAGTATYVQLAFDSLDTPYVTYKDAGNSNKATVMKYDGSEWSAVGNTGFSAGTVEYVNIAFDSSDTPYVVYQDNENGDKATVMKYAQRSWSEVGSAGFSEDRASYTGLAFDSRNTLHMVYADIDANSQATMMQYLEENNSWEYLGEKDFSNSSVSYLNLAFDHADIPYVVYKDFSNSLKASVMKGVISGLVGTPGNDDIGIHDINLTLSDSTETITHNFQIMVNSVNDAPFVTSSALSTAVEDSNYSALLQGSDEEDDTLIWSVASGTILPSWLTLNAQESWEVLGSAGLSGSTATYTDIAFDSNNTPYVFCNDSALGFNAVVRKYTGSSWEIVNNFSGLGGFTISVEYADMLVDESDNIYVAYADKSNHDKATLKKYDGSSWSTVGVEGFSSDSAFYTQMALDSNNTPYMVFQDGANSDKASVMKYDGANWVSVGSAGFSAGKAEYTSIVIDSSDTIYVAFKDYVNDEKTTVMQYDGVNWNTLGSAGFSDEIAFYTKLALDSNDTLYIVYSDFSDDFRTTVKKYDGSTWVSVGNANFSAGAAVYNDIVIDSSDNIYVTYRDGGNSQKASVMKYDGHYWTTVGSAGFSDDVANYTQIALDSSDTPYVVYQDSAVSNKASVMKLSPSALSGTPSNDDVGVNDVNLTLSDGENNTSYNFQITVSNTNDAPSASNSTITMNEDGNYAFGAEDFLFDDMDGDSFYSLFITSLPDNGRLTYSNGDVSLNQQISYATISNLIFSPALHANGTAYTSFGFVVSDGELNSTTEYTMSINVDAVNDTPTVISDGLISVDEDALYHYTLEGSDIEEDTLTWSVTSGTALPSWLTLTPQNSWELVGGSPASSEGGDYTKMAFDSHDTPYVIFRDYDNGNHATVLKYDGNWSSVGAVGFSSDSVTYTNIAFDHNDTLYAIYSDSNVSGKATVMHFDGASWSSVGNEGISVGSVTFTQLAFDSSNTPYIVYSDAGDDFKINVKRFDGSSWITVGNSSFSAGNATNDQLLFDSSDTPYVVFKDRSEAQVSDHKITVMQLVGNIWMPLGSERFSSGEVFDTRMAFDNNNTAYVVYKDASIAGSVVIKTYDGNDWVDFAETINVDTSAYYTDIVIDENDTLYVSFINGAQIDTATLKKYSNDIWQSVAQAVFSTMTPGFAQIALNSQNEPYIFYMDFSDTFKPTLKQYVQSALEGTPTNTDVGIHDINLTLSDGENNVTHNFQITVTNTGDAPTDIALTGSSILENNAIGDVIGTLSATDEDIGDTHFFSLTCNTSGADDGDFSISGDVLYIETVADYETQSSYEICIIVYDDAQLFYERNVTISITDDVDTDSDGMEDAIDTDDDGDGMSDDFENQYGLNQFDETDANEDKDNDGYTNLQEYKAGTNPDDDTDKPSSGVNPSIIMYLLS